MPVDRTALSRATAAEKRAVALFITHVGVRALFRPMLTRFSPTNYLRQHDAVAAKKYIETQWQAVRDYMAVVPLTFTTHVSEVSVLVAAGWAEPFGGDVKGYYRWKPAGFQAVFESENLETLLGPAGYARLWGMIFLGYLRGVFADMTLDDAISNDRAEQLLLQEPKFSTGDYGTAFGREVQRVWAPQQAVNWAKDEIPIVMADLKDSHRLLAAMLVRIYTGVMSSPEIRRKFGNFRPGMAPVSRMALVGEEE